MQAALTLHRSGSLGGISMFLTETRVPKANVNSPVSGMFWITHVADYQPTRCSSSLPQLFRKRQVGIDLLVKSSSLPVLVLSDELLGSTDKDWLFALQKTSAAQTEPSSEHNLNCEPPGQWVSDSQHRLHAWPRANIVPNALITRGRFHQAREALVT